MLIMRRKLKRASRKSACLISCIIILIQTAATILASDEQFTPSIRWQRQIPGSGYLSGRGIRKSNGVVTTKDGRVWVVSDDGGLFIFDPQNGDLLFESSTQPPAQSLSRSSIHFYYSDKDHSNLIYGVYAVISIGGGNSWVVAVNDDGSERWSQRVNGVIEGTPIIGQYGRYVYVTHNVHIGDNIQNPTRHGSFSVLSDDPAEIENSFVFHGNSFGPAERRLLKGEDSIYWANSKKFGHADDGAVYQYDSGGNRILQMDVAWSSVVAPTMSSANDWMWFGGSSSSLYGMGDDLSYQSLSWEASLQKNWNNESTPLLNRPVASSDGKTLFVASASTKVYRIDAEMGEKKWRDEISELTPNFYMTEPRVSLDEEKVYIMLHRDGKITEYDTDDGSKFWTFSCVDITGLDDCEDSVEAEFSLSSDGRTLFYGDIFGKLVALRLYPDTPSSSPTPVPAIATPLPPQEFSTQIEEETTSSSTQTFNRPVMTSLVLITFMFLNGFEQYM